MAEETSTTETVTKISSGNVKITLEEYNDLNMRANEPKTVVVNRTVIEKTPEIAATDLVHAGAFCMGGGGTLFVIGAIQFIAGKRKLAALAKATTLTSV